VRTMYSSVGIRGSVVMYLLDKKVNSTVIISKIDSVQSHRYRVTRVQITTFASLLAVLAE
jgi:hypothetical protein